MENIEPHESKMELVAYEIARKIANIPDNKPEHADDHRLHSIHHIIMNTMRMVERDKGKELASLKEIVKELIPIAEARNITVDDPNWQNKWRHQCKVINRAKTLIG